MRAEQTVIAVQVETRPVCGGRPGALDLADELRRGSAGGFRGLYAQPYG